MRQALLDVGLSAKGGNYKRCHNLKREYEEHIVQRKGHEFESHRGY